MYHPRVNKVNCLFTRAKPVTTSGVVHRLLGFIECESGALMGMWGINKHNVYAWRLHWSRYQTIPGCR